MNTALFDVDEMCVPKDPSLLREQVCGDVLSPIPGERRECVEPAGHVLGGHVAEDGTRW